jgi:hypothetical protein
MNIVKKRIFSIVIAIFIAGSIISVPISSHASSIFTQFVPGDLSDCFLEADSVTFNSNEKISNTYYDQGERYYFCGKVQQITVYQKSQISLYAKIRDSWYDNDSIYFAISRQGNAEQSNIIDECETTKNSLGHNLATKQIELNKGTYYLVLYTIQYENAPASSYTADIAVRYAINLDAVAAPVVPNKTYTGAPISPSIKLTYGNRSLVENEDYLLSYSYNTNPGKAYGFIYGVGDFYGTKRFTFNIKVTPPKKAAVKKVKSKKKKRLTVYWKRDSKATGYQVVIAQNKKFKKGKKTATIRKNKTTSKTFKRLKSKKKYYAKVRSYKVIDGKKYYGAYSKVKSVKVK